MTTPLFVDWNRRRHPALDAAIGAAVSLRAIQRNFLCEKVSA